MSEAIPPEPSSIGRPPVREHRPADYDDYEHTGNDLRRALPNLGQRPQDDDRRDEDRPRWRAYDDGERRRDERRDRDW